MGIWLKIGRYSGCQKSDSIFGNSRDIPKVIATKMGPAQLACSHLFKPLSLQKLPALQKGKPSPARNPEKEPDTGLDRVENRCEARIV